MATYRRWFRDGGTYFFTLVCERRAALFSDAANVDRLRAAMARCRTGLPFDVVAAAVLPDHVHLILTLPDDDRRVLRPCGKATDRRRHWQRTDRGTGFLPISRASSVLYGLR